MDPRISRPAEHHAPSLPSIHHVSPVQPPQLTQPSPTHPHPHPPVAHHPPPPPQNHRGSTSTHPYHPPPPTYGPPPSHYPPPSRSERTPDHGHTGEGSGHATPVNRQAPEFPTLPPQRTSSAPSQPPSSMSMRHPSERAPEGPPHQHPQHQYHYEAPPPPGHHPPYYPPPPHQHPLPQAEPGAPPPHQMVEAGPYPMHHPPPQYGPGIYPPSYAPPGQPIKKKSNRASTACDRCRERKSKCDEKIPCSTCEEQGVPCKYRESLDKKGLDKAAPSVLTTIHDIVAGLPNTGEEILAKLSRLEKLLDSQSSSLDLGRDMKREEIPRRDTPAAEAMSKSESAPLPGSQPLTRSQSLQGPPQSSVTAAPPVKKEELEPAEEVSDFDEHTTAAHKLLYLWPSIHNLFQKRDRNQLKKNYVVHGEARGWLRLDGAGEAEKPSELGTFNDSADTLEASSPQTPDLWDNSTALRADPKRMDLISEPTRMDLRQNTVYRLLDLYCRNIHALHPFLDMPTLEKFLPTFIKRHASPDPRGGPSSPFVPVNGEGAHRSNKRKRSEPYLGAENQAGSTGQASRMSNERSMPVAITYLVLALGSVCEWQGMIPGPVNEEAYAGSMPPPSVPYSGSPPATSKPSPASTMSYSGSTPGSMDARVPGQSPRSMYDSPGPGLNRRARTNIDQIPGLAYYKEACQILGLFSDSNELAVAQARLLAGLYKGQLGRVQESWSWISDACRICRYQVRMNGLDKGSNETHQWKHPAGSKRDIFENTVLLVCWSALQLESDILAELDYPHSGLAALQASIPTPRTTLPRTEYQQANQQPDRPTVYYHKQLFLRKRLNELHAELYGKNLPSLRPTSLATILNFTFETLLRFRSIIHTWDDQELPAEDILEVRLRAKFYGAHYISLRPYLDYVLHAMDGVKTGIHASELARDAHGNERKNEAALFAAMETMDESVTQDRARQCIQAAIRSTVAFDRIPGRLIVTNIMGTSHAQFSNMLVLSAAWNSGKPFLRELIPEDTLKGLFSRTIHFLSQLRYCSPTANQDVRYLQMIWRGMFPNDPVPVMSEDDFRGSYYYGPNVGGMVSGGSFGSDM